MGEESRPSAGAGNGHTDVHTLRGALVALERQVDSLLSECREYTAGIARLEVRVETLQTLVAGLDARLGKLDRKMQPKTEMIEAKAVDRERAIQHAKAVEDRVTILESARQGMATRTRAVVLWALAAVAGGAGSLILKAIEKILFP